VVTVRDLAGGKHVFRNILRSGEATVMLVIHEDT
jgi:hypothetical protein